MPKILVENCCGKLLRKIAAENCCWKLLLKIAAENVDGHTEFMPLVKMQAYEGTMVDVKISAPRKISAPSQNLKSLAPSYYWAWQNLPLLTSSKSGWKALVQILVNVLILRHEDFKWSEGSGRSSFMGGVSPVLYRLVVPARPVKFSRIHAAAEIFTISCEKSKILSRLLSVLSLHRKFVHDHCCCPNSATMLTDS